MVSGTMPSDLEIYMDANDPTEAGDIKVVRGNVLTLDSCDSLTQWSVHSGSVSLVVDTNNVAEGTGSILATCIPIIGTTAVIECNKSSGSWDLSTYKYIKVKLRRAYNANPTFLKFGESGGEFDNSTAISMSGTYVWEEHVYDISAIASGDRDQVTSVSITAAFTQPIQGYLWIDELVADPGPSQIKAYDGDRVITIYPKIVAGAYEGEGSTGHVIYLSSASSASVAERKGTPCEIMVIGSTRSTPCYWCKGMASQYSVILGSDRTLHGIWSVTDGSFTVGSTSYVNGSGNDYLFVAKYED